VTRLDEQLKSHYEKKHLPGESLDRILDSTESTGHRRIWLTAIATAAVLLIAFGFYEGNVLKRDLASRVFQEIAMNHEKALDIEVASVDYRELQGQMDRIDFEISPGTEFTGTYSLIGGRYCSIQGGLAAQLKVKHAGTGIVHTLYVTRLTSTLEPLPEQARNHGNTHIKLWKDGLRLFALAGGPVD
jgi:hypothetical protein